MANQLADYAAAYPPLFEPSSFTESWIESCADDPPGTPSYTYNRTTERVYEGVFYESSQSPWSGAYYPSDPWGNPKFSAGRKIGCPAPRLLQHYVADSAGRRYGAFQKPVPVVCVGPFSIRQVEPGGVTSEYIYLTGSDTTLAQFVTNNVFSFDWYQYSAFGNCEFWVLRRLVGGLAPVHKFMWETVMTMVSGSGAVTTMALPNQRHEFYADDPPLPIPEVIWQKIPYPELGLVFWLHNWRDSITCACGAPMITVTDTALTTVVFTIPASEFFPLTKFSGDQFYTIGSEDIYWAYDGEYEHFMNGREGKGPLMKLLRREVSEDTYEHYLLVCVEYYQRVAPIAGDEVVLIGTSETFFVEDSENGDGYRFALQYEPSQIDSVQVDESGVDYIWPSGEDISVVELTTALLSGEELVIEYQYEEPAGIPASEGESYVKTVLIRVDETSYTVEKVDSVLNTYTYPNIEMPFSTWSVDDLRLAAILGDRLLLGFVQVRV